jgi:hypothetical protein
MIIGDDSSWWWLFYYILLVLATPMIILVICDDLYSSSTGKRWSEVPGVQDEVLEPWYGVGSGWCGCQEWVTRHSTWHRHGRNFIPWSFEEINLIDAVGRRWPTRVYSAIMPCSGNGPHTRNDTAPGGSWLFVRGDCVQHVQNQQRSTHYPSIHSVSQFPFSHKSQDLHVSILWSVKSHFSIFWLVRFPTNYSIYRYVYYIYINLYIPNK